MLRSLPIWTFILFAGLTVGTFFFGEETVEAKAPQDLQLENVLTMQPDASGFLVISRVQNCLRWTRWQLSVTEREFQIAPGWQSLVFSLGEGLQAGSDRTNACAEAVLPLFAVSQDGRQVAWIQEGKDGRNALYSETVFGKDSGARPAEDLLRLNTRAGPRNARPLILVFLAKSRIFLTYREYAFPQIYSPKANGSRWDDSFHRSITSPDFTEARNDTLAYLSRKRGNANIVRFGTGEMDRGQLLSAPMTSCEGTGERIVEEATALHLLNDRSLAIGTSTGRVLIGTSAGDRQIKNGFGTIREAGASWQRPDCRAVTGLAVLGEDLLLASGDFSGLSAFRFHPQRGLRMDPDTTRVEELSVLSRAELVAGADRIFVHSSQLGFIRNGKAFLTRVRAVKRLPTLLQIMSAAGALASLLAFWLQIRSRRAG